MYTQKQLLPALKVLLKNQQDFMNNGHNDYVARQYVSRINRFIQQVEVSHKTDIQKCVVLEHTDYRSCGDDHSEVSNVSIFRCCRSCCEAVQFLLKDQYKFVRGKYLSVSEDTGQELNKKIITYKAQSYAQSLDSDEMRINSEYLD